MIYEKKENNCTLPLNIEKFTNDVPLVALLNGYNNLSDESIIKNLNDKVEEGIDPLKVAKAIYNNINYVDPELYYKSDITPVQIDNLNKKINNYLSCTKSSK